jgi:hypothetical protein
MKLRSTLINVSGLNGGSDFAGAGVGSPSGQEARTAVDRPPLRGIEGHGCLLSALGTLHRDFDTLANSRRLCCRYRSQAFVLGLLARLATLGFILQSLVVKKDLLASSPDKVLATVDTLDGAIFEMCFGLILIHV